VILSLFVKMKVYLKHLIRIYLFGSLLFTCILCTPKDNSSNYDFLNRPIDSLDITAIWDDVKPLIRQYPVQIFSRDDESYYMFIKNWGDFYKMDKDGNPLWKLSFNDKHIDSNHKLDLKGITIGVGYYDKSIYFLESNAGYFLSTYDEEGQLQQKLSNIPLGDAVVEFRILDSSTMLVVRQERMQDVRIFKFSKYNFITKSSEELFEIENQSSGWEICLVKIIENNIYLMGTHQKIIDVYSMSGNKINSIEIQSNSKRRFNNIYIPSTVDYFSLSRAEKIQYANDYTLDYSSYEDGLFILHYIIDREDTTSNQFSRLLTFETSDAVIEYLIDPDNIFRFDDYGNLVYSKEVDGKKFIYKVPKDKMDKVLKEKF